MSTRRSFIARSAALFVLLGWVGPGAAAQPAPARIPVVLELQRAGERIDRHLFGQFAEHLGHGIYDGLWVGADSAIPNTRGIRNDVVAALTALRIPDVRWPGGCFADEYHWRDGIGRPEHRAQTLNSNWGGVLETNRFGVHEFMDFLQQIGAEAYLAGNVGSGSPQETAQWLEYLTARAPTSLALERAANGHAAPYSVAFFGVGNESWGCGGSMSAQHYADLYRQFATFAKNFNPDQQGASRMRLIASGPHDAEYGWTDVLMRSAAQSMDGLSLHFYSGFEHWPPTLPATGFDEGAYATVLATALRMEQLIRAHASIMDRYDPARKVALVVDEWGAWYAPTPGTNPAFLMQQNSQRDAILAALTLDIFARHADRVRMANIAQMINVLQAMILTDGPRMLLTPTYHVFRMYVPFQDAQFIPLRFHAGRYRHGPITLPRLDALAARSADGTLHLSLVNLDPAQPLSVEIAAPGLALQAASGWTLIAAAIDAANSFEQPDLVRPRPISVRASGATLSLQLAPESVTVLALE